MKKKLKIGILGYGEVGRAMASFYEKPYVRDLERDDFAGLMATGRVLDVLHVCLPHSPGFDAIVGDAIRNSCPQGVVIIHSTVPVGTTQRIREQVGVDAIGLVHSPVRGVHPELALGIKTFIKYIGSDSPTAGEYASAHLESLGIRTMVLYKSRTSELLKLLDTTYYGIAIAFHAYAHGLCEKEEVNFDMVMSDANETYNEGYKALRKDNVVRPVLTAPRGQIGGHCIIPNAELLKKEYGDDPILKAILRHK